MIHPGEKSSLVLLLFEEKPELHNVQIVGFYKNVGNWMVQPFVVFFLYLPNRNLHIPNFKNYILPCNLEARKALSNSAPDNCNKHWQSNFYGFLDNWRPADKALLTIWAWRGSLIRRVVTLYHLKSISQKIFQNLHYHPHYFRTFRPLTSTKLTSFVFEGFLPITKKVELVFTLTECCWNVIFRTEFNYAYLRTNQHTRSMKKERKLFCSYICPYPVFG